MIALLENNPQSLQGNSAAVSRRFSNRNVPLNRQRTARTAKARPSIEELREYLDYEPETGALTWKKSPGGGTRQGQAIGGSLNSNGYGQLCFRGTKFGAHQVAFALWHGRWPSPCCDHIDGDRSNNRADNLRECDLSANQHNSKISRNNTTGVKGVARLGEGYLARARIKGVAHNKYFRRLEDAAAYVKRLREQLHGEFARHE